MTQEQFDAAVEWLRAPEKEHGDLPDTTARVYVAACCVIRHRSGGDIYAGWDATPTPETWAQIRALLDDASERQRGILKDIAEDIDLTKERIH